MIVLERNFIGNAYPLTHGRVCWEWHSGSITASTEAAGFDAENAKPPRTDTAWRPTSLPAEWELTFSSARKVSFIGIAKHDLGTKNATLSLAYSADGGSTFTNFPGLGALSPGDDTPILALVGERDVDAVRVRIASADDMPTISVAMAGIADEWPRPFVWTDNPITEGDRITYEKTISLTGNWLGRTKVSDGLSFDLTMNNASEEWRQNDFAAFKRYANGEDAVFFIAPRPTSDYRNEVAFAWGADVITATRQTANKAISTSVTLSCQGLRTDV